jgi:hypothetical protein
LVLDLTILVPFLKLQNSKKSEKPSKFFFENRKPQKIWKFQNIIQFFLKHHNNQKYNPFYFGIFQDNQIKNLGKKTIEKIRK